MNTSIIRLSATPPGFGAVSDSVADNISGNPTQHTHEYYSDDELGLYVGVWDTTDMLEPAEPYAMDEFMLVLEGTAAIKDNRRNTITTINAGESFAIPKGYDCQWKQEGYLRKFFLISCHPDEEVPTAPSYDGVVLPEQTQDKSRSTVSNPFLSNDLGSVEYTDTKDRFRVSTWITEPFEAPTRRFPNYQLSIVRSGSLAIVDEQQVRHHFVAGDAFFIPMGTLCSATAQRNTSIVSATLSA